MSRNWVKDIGELNKISLSGFVYVEKVCLWAFRWAPNNSWVFIPQDVLDQDQTMRLINTDELVGRLFRCGYRVEAEMILKQIEEATMRIMSDQLKAEKEEKEYKKGE